MPYTQDGLPLAGSCFEARKASRAAARHVAPRADSQLRRVIGWLLAREDGDHWEARQELGLKPQSCCARFGELRWAGVLHRVAETTREHDGDAYSVWRLDRLSVGEIERQVAIAKALRASARKGRVA